ncbi:hypothetical protein GY45DRAFT_1375043 [Cubamyces sp. BRFM 1775]|nr:hypothetical protein GY45DRAFT_1375043 [Cubamyces sp. BRFM 1775]
MALDAVRNIEPSGHPVLHCLQKLRLLDFIDAFSQLLSSALAVVIYHTAPPTPIRTLGLHSTSLCGAGINDLSGWYEAITHIRDTLICLSVTVAVALDRFPEHPDGTRFPTAICRCEQICHFALRYRPGPYLRLTHWDQPDYFLNSVRLMFSYTPPRFARVLESFVLAMPYEPPPYGPGSILGQLTHLIKALLNTEKYPALTTFRFCITSEISTVTTDFTTPNNAPPLPEARTWVETITAVLEPLRGRGVEVETKFMRADEWDARYG